LNTVGGGYKQVNLVSDGAVPAAKTDLFLVNPWGIAFSPTGPFWTANNHSGTSTLYDGAGDVIRLTVTIPLPQSLIPPIGAPAAPAAPDGIVFNGTGGFQVTPHNPALFIFAAEDGTISGWSPAANLYSATLEVDNSDLGTVYKGLAMGRSKGADYLYATDFHNGRVDVFDAHFKPVNWSGAFTDAAIPPGFAPFGIINIKNRLYVTYAKQKAPENHDDQAGPGNGYIDVYGTDGTFLRHLTFGDTLNSPWGMALAPANFGPFSGALLVGNFGDGHISAFNIDTGAFQGLVGDVNGNAIAIEGLWGLLFGNGGGGGATNKLYFTAGPGNPPGSGKNLESHGRLGDIELGP
jgi:uncharacterized protein (TIGR03118 family)